MNTDYDMDRMMARKEHLLKTNDPPWKCFHCGQVIHSQPEAEEHFGKDPAVIASCCRDELCPITLKTCSLVRDLASANERLERAVGLLRRFKFAVDGDDSADASWITDMFILAEETGAFLKSPKEPGAKEGK